MMGNMGYSIPNETLSALLDRLECFSILLIKGYLEPYFHKILIGHAILLNVRPA